MLPPLTENVKNIVTVAKSGGDFRDPSKALNSITDASASNQYMVLIAPGVYNMNNKELVLKPYIHVVGSGRKATKLRRVNHSVPQGEIASVVSLVKFSSVSDLTVENNSPNGSNISISAAGESAEIRDVDISMNSNAASGIYGVFSESPGMRMSGVNIFLTGNTTLIGILLSYSKDFASPFSSDVIAGSDVSDSTIRIALTGSSPAAAISTGQPYSAYSNVRASVQGFGGAGTLFGIVNNTFEGPVYLRDSFIEVKDGGSMTGIRNFNLKGTFRIYNSQILSGGTSVSAGLGADENESYLFGTLLSGAVEGNPECISTFVELSGDDAC